MQQQFDFHRAAQHALVENANIPDLRADEPQRVRASASVCSLVLRALNSHGSQIYPSMERIARQANLKTVRTVKRAIARLESLGLIIKQKRRLPNGTVGNSYRIVWSELALIDGRKMPPSKGGAKSAVDATHKHDPTFDAIEIEIEIENHADNIPNVPERGDMVTERGDMVTERGDIQSLARGHTVPQTTKETQNNLHQPVARIAAGEGGGGEVFEIGQMLRSAGCRFWKPLAAEFADLGVAKVAAAIAVYNANRRRLAGPGALVMLLRVGSLPIEGAIDPQMRDLQHAKARLRRAAEESAAAQQASEAAQLERAIDAHWSSLDDSDRCSWIDRVRTNNAMLSGLDPAHPRVVGVAKAESWSVTESVRMEVMR